MRPWLTSTVVALMTGIDADGGYDRLPVLADALDDAGCDDGELVAALRAGDPAFRRPWYRRAVEGAATAGEVRAAVAWLTAHGRAIGTDATDEERAEPDFDPAWDRSAIRPGDDPLAWVVESCRRYAEDGEETLFGYDTPGKAYDDAGEMWRQYAVLTGKRPPDEGGRPPMPYRCAC